MTCGVTSESCDKQSIAPTRSSSWTTADMPRDNDEVIADSEDENDSFFLPSTCLSSVPRESDSSEILSILPPTTRQVAQGTPHPSAHCSIIHDLDTTQNRYKQPRLTPYIRLQLRRIYRPCLHSHYQNRTPHLKHTPTYLRSLLNRRKG